MVNFITFVSVLSMVDLTQLKIFILKHLGVVATINETKCFFYLWKLKYVLVAPRSSRSKTSTLEEQETIKEKVFAKNVKASKKPNH
jgi:hypothetical protein